LGSSFFKTSEYRKEEVLTLHYRMLLWSASALIVMLDIGNTLFWFRGMTSFAAASMVSFLYFTQSILNRKIKYDRLIYIYSVIAVSVTLLTNLIIPNADNVNGVLKYTLSPLVYLVAGPSYIVMAVCLIRLMESARSTNDENQVTRFTILVVAVACVLIEEVSTLRNWGNILSMSPRT
jgi:predicted membrane protein